MMKIEDSPLTREEKQIDKLTLDELAEQIQLMSGIISYAVRIKANEPFKQALQKRAGDYRQLLRDRYDFLKELKING